MQNYYARKRMCRFESSYKLISTKPHCKAEDSQYTSRYCEYIISANRTKPSTLICIYWKHGILRYYINGNQNYSNSILY